MSFSPNVPDQGDTWTSARFNVQTPGLTGIQILAHVTTGVDRGIGDIAIDDVKVTGVHAAHAPTTVT